MAIHRSHHHRSWTGIIALSALLILRSSSAGKKYLVGDTTWTIPSPPSLYINWSSSTILFPGDYLVFDFDFEFHNVMQVTRFDYDSCTTQNPIKTMLSGPAIVPLVEPGVFYFICNLSNYCDLGQKVCVVVHKYRSNPPQSPSPAPIRGPFLPSTPPSSPRFRPVEPISAPIESPIPMPTSAHANPFPMSQGSVDHQGNSIAIFLLILVIMSIVL